jgi:hypothetical protein
MEVNKPEVVAPMLGWFAACFLRQFHHQASGQFPLLMVYGEAGSGKSTIVEILSRMFYYKSRPIILQAGATTPHALQGALLSSASIPVILDEYKPRQMPMGRHNALLNAFRSAYNAQAFSKGGMGDDSNWRDLRMMSYSAPVLFIGEAAETETAVVERTLFVPVPRIRSDVARKAKNYLQDHRTTMAMLGRELMDAALRTMPEEFKEEMREEEEVIRALAPADTTNDRVIYNIAAARHGLKFLEKVICEGSSKQGARLSDGFEVLQQSFLQLDSVLCERGRSTVGTTMSEASKVLHQMAAMTYLNEDPTQQLELGVDYTIAQGKYLDISLRPAYIKYATWCRRRGFSVLFDDEGAFALGMANHRALISSKVIDSPLRDTQAHAKVYRFDLDKLEAEGVDPFKIG